MVRRTFLKNAGLAGAPFFLNGLGLSAMAKPRLFSAVNDESDRVLVLIRLAGGNDGLNTIIPIDQYDNLHQARPNVIIPENQILSLTDTVGLHPVLTGLKSLYEDARLGIVQSVGYPNQNRSHFKSMQIWNSANPDDFNANTGWIGRYLDDEYPGFPSGYPNGSQPDPFAIAMGSFVSETCQGSAANFSISLEDPFALGDLEEWSGSDDSGTAYGAELSFLRETITQSNAYYDRIQGAVENASNLADYPQTTLAEQLKHVARMIAGGLQTKIYTVNLNKFDTHSRQVEDNNTTIGQHATLLETLSEAVRAFQTDLQLLGLEERVIGMTFSEFGRQIRSNASNGTDHGTAAPLILFGSCVQPQILGDNPDIPDQVAVQEGVPMQYDFRDVYGSLLMDWFDVPVDQVRSLLYDDFQYLSIIGCGIPTSSGSGEAVPTLDTQVFPNPFRDETTIRFITRGEWVRLSVFDAMGSELNVLTNQRLPAGEHQLRFDGRRLPAGNYYVRLVAAEQHQMVRVVKVR